MANEETDKIEEAIKNEQYPLALDLCDKTIKCLGRRKALYKKFIVSKAMTLLAVTLGLQTAKKQMSGEFEDSQKDEMWKPVFSCLGTAIAYQTAIDDMLGLSETMAHNIVFRLQKSDNFEDVLPEIQSAVNFIRKLRYGKISDEKSLIRLRDIEYTLRRLNPTNIQTLSIETMMIK